METLLEDLRRKVPPGSDVQVRMQNPSFDRPSDQYNTWDACVTSGRDYLVGAQMDLKQFLRTHTSTLNEWQRAAYKLAWNYPHVQVMVNTGEYGPRKYEWVVYRRGEYVDFSLPHQDAGGERDYISRDGRRRILININ